MILTFSFDGQVTKVVQSCFHSKAGKSPLHKQNACVFRLISKSSQPTQQQKKHIPLTYCVCYSHHQVRRDRHSPVRLLCHSGFNLLFSCLCSHLYCFSTNVFDVFFCLCCQTTKGVSKSDLTVAHKCYLLTKVTSNFSTSIKSNLSDNINQCFLDTETSEVHRNSFTTRPATESRTVKRPS